MLKRLILALLLTFSITVFAQEEKFNFFEEAQKAFKSNDLKRAHGLFSLAQKFDSKQENVNISFRKADSLKVVLRKNLIEAITGNWKMVTPESWALREPSDSIVGKMITIEKNEILFYELYPKAKKWNLVRTEHLVFSEKINMSTDPLLIVYSNREVWEYYVDEISGNLIAYYVGEENEETISELACGNPKVAYFKLQ
ncbi:hypothetical protein K6T82_21605 [Flavobacterium sp. 17A]|uniref:GLPGLI family protein n=1 Tax=Flavobacterium potami TaxID=2872310 RepID=A0A9X1KUB4_9FLAO|nr:hypothetical protein [Flavobacterium potami]MBZ4037371.1 hypothetical protein [Flavobacterium potami]